MNISYKNNFFKYLFFDHYLGTSDGSNAIFIAS